MVNWHHLKSIAVCEDAKRSKEGTHSEGAKNCGMKCERKR